MPKNTVFARVAKIESGSYRRGTNTSPRAAATFAALASERHRSTDTNRSNWSGALLPLAFRRYRRWQNAAISRPLWRRIGAAYVRFQRCR